MLDVDIVSCCGGRLRTSAGKPRCGYRELESWGSFLVRLRV
jgi:hypothetical protein